MQQNTTPDVHISRRLTIVHSHGPGGSCNALEDSSPDTRSLPLSQDTDPLQKTTSQERLHLGRYYNDQEDALLTSTQRSSSTCVINNQNTVLDESFDSHACLTPSSSRLPAEQGYVSVPHRQCYIDLLRKWMWEALSIVSSLGLLTAILVTLARCNHGTQPEWPYNININSLISVFTTIIIAQLGFILAGSRYSTRYTNPLPLS